MSKTINPRNLVVLMHWMERYVRDDTATSSETKFDAIRKRY